MAIYKRYNTRRRRIPRTVVVCVLAVAVVFILTAVLGSYLGSKAEGGEALYTGTDALNNGGTSLAPLAEKSLHGYYVEPKKLSSFVAENEEVWASTWIYKDGEAVFATATDKKLGTNTSKLPSLDSFAIDANTIGLFEVGSVYADAQIRNVVTEYESALLDEFFASGLDEIVLVFNEVSEENMDAVLDFAESVNGATVVCVPYSTLENDEFFAQAASKQLSLAVKADKLTAKKLREDIDRFAFYFTRYNLRMVLGGKDKALVDVLKENTLLNYQFCSATEDKK